MDGDSSQKPLGLTADDPLAGLAKWVADGRVDAAARERARLRWLERQAQEETNLAGVLLDLAERRSSVAVHTRAGATVRGRAVALGADFVVVREPRRGDVFVPLAALATVRGASLGEPALGDRATTLVVVLAEAIAELAADRPLVLVAVAGEGLRGELRSAGTDVVAVATASTTREVVHIALDAIDHLVILAR